LKSLPQNCDALSPRERSPWNHAPPSIVRESYKTFLESPECVARNCGTPGYQRMGTVTKNRVVDNINCMLRNNPLPFVKLLDWFELSDRSYLKGNNSVLRIEPGSMWIELSLVGAVD